MGSYQEAIIQEGKEEEKAEEWQIWTFYIVMGILMEFMEFWTQSHSQQTTISQGLASPEY